MRFLRRSLMGVFLLAVTAGLLVWAGDILYSSLQARMNQEGRQRPARERVFAVNVQEFQPGSVEPQLTTFGELRSRRQLEVRAPASGTIVQLAENFEEGGHVRKGALMLQVDPADAQVRVQQAQIDLAEAQTEQRDAERSLALAREEVKAAEAQWNLRTRALGRQRDLQTRGVGTEAAVETAELAAASANQAVVSRKGSLASAEARIDQAGTRLSRQKINLTEAERSLADTKIYAGFDGTLSGVTLVEGGLVTANERLAQLIDPLALEVTFRLSAAQYARILDEQGRLLGLPVVVTLDVFGVDIQAQGRVSRESAAVGEGQTGRLIFASLDDPKGFRPGDFVTVKMTEPALERVALLPATAVDAAQTVLIVGQDERLETAVVEVLRRQGDDVIIRARGLNGRQIVTERSPLLGAGIKVRVLTPGDETPTGAPAAAPPEPEMVELTPDRRAAIIAFVEANNRMPKDVKERILGQLAKDKVSAQVVKRIEGRMGG